MARLSESSKCVLVCVVEYLSMQALGVVLSDVIARPGEGISPM